MARVMREEIGSFNPILRDYFECPVCGSTKFVELVPYGGLWCERCNAQIEILSTCDGPNKVSVHVRTKHCHEGEWIANIIANSIHGGRAFDYAWAVIWEYDTEIRWMKSKDGKMTSFLEDNG